MGCKDNPQSPLFYSFDLDEVVPQDHLLRKIDRFLDLSDLRQHLASYYSHTGRPSVDPELMIRMLIIGYCLGIRSERRLCEEARRRTKVAGAFPDGESALMLVAARLRHVSATRWGTRKYMNMKLLQEMDKEIRYSAA